MLNNTSSSFHWKEVNITLNPVSFLTLKYTPVIIDQVSYEFGDSWVPEPRVLGDLISGHFKAFVKKCHRKLSRIHRQRKIKISTSTGMPVATLPDKTEIVTVNESRTGGEMDLIHFVWLGKADKQEVPHAS